MQTAVTATSDSDSAFDRMLARHRISRSELAARSGVSYKTVCRIAKSGSLGTLDTWARFAKALGCGVGELLDELSGEVDVVREFADHR